MPSRPTKNDDIFSRVFITHGVDPWVFLLPGHGFYGMVDDMAQRAQKKTSAFTWKGREVPVLNEAVCTGCGLCCALCPTDCLIMAGPMPWMPRPAACIGCAVCALACPAAALDMKVLAAEEDCDGM